MQRGERVGERPPFRALARPSELLPARTHPTPPSLLPSGTLAAKINWRVPLDAAGRFSPRSTVQTFVPSPASPSILLNHGNEYLHYEDDWYILASKKDAYVAVYYKGKNDAWDGYGGAVIYTRDPKFPTRYQGEIAEALKGAGVDWKDMTLTDNACKAQPPPPPSLTQELAANAVAVEGEIVKDITAVEGELARDLTAAESILAEDALILEDEALAAARALAATTATAAGCTIKHGQHAAHAADGHFGRIAIIALGILPLAGAKLALDVNLRSLAQIAFGNADQAVGLENDIVPVGPLLLLARLSVLPGLACGDA